MDKRFQVFVSSTYADLKEERSRVIQTLMEMDCIPAGMELFPAMDEDQFEFIKRIIDDCDYYLLIVGGRYGSTSEEGISYTEKEFDYAIARGLKVLAFLHEDPDQIPTGKTDKDPALAERLKAFRQKAMTSRLIKHWKRAEELPGLVSLSLSKTIKTYPAVGWVRASSSDTTELLSEINALRKANDELREQLASRPLEQRVTVPDLAGADATFELRGTYKPAWDAPRTTWTSNLTFSQYFALLAPHLLKHPNDELVEVLLPKLVLEHLKREVYQCDVQDLPFQTLKIQLKALGLVSLTHSKTVKGAMGLIWELTGAGEAAMLQLRTVRGGA